DVCSSDLVYDTHAAGPGFDSLERGHGVLRLAAAGPGTERRGLVIGERADHGDGVPPRTERQQLAVVLEQYDRFFGDTTSQLAVLGREQRRSLAFGAGAVVGIVEQAEGYLSPEHPAHRLVDHRYGNAAGADQ